MGQAFEVEHFLWFVLAFGASFLLTPLVRLAAVRLGFVDHPKERRIHTRPLPMGGGVALFIAFWITIAGRLRSAGARRFGRFQRPLLLVGLVDDAVELRWYWKLAGQVAAASILIAYGERIEFVTHPLRGETVYIGAWGIPLTLLWLVAMANMINFIDGLDGLAAGVCTIAVGSALFDRGLAGPVGGGSDDGRDCRGAAPGFFPHNFNPARIIMGDTGAMFLGLPWARSASRAPSKERRPGVRRPSPGVWGCRSLTRFLPSRGASRAANPSTCADWDHLHHRLLATGVQPAPGRPHPRTA